MYDFYKENADSVNAFIVVFIMCVCGIWFTIDYHRNKPVYNNTDSTMADIDSRLKSIEQRIGRIQERTAAIEQTVGGISATVNAGRENAVTVADGLNRAEERLDAIIQRQGRITNIINEIERANQ